MNVLADVSLRQRLMSGSLGASPLQVAAVQPASLDLTLGNRLLSMEYGVIVDPEKDQSNHWCDVDLRTDGRWFVGGMHLYLGVTAERIRIPDDCLGLLSGISSLGRQGIQIHVTAGLVDPGFVGRLTLEIVVFGQGAFLTPGMRIAQLSLFQLDWSAQKPYAGRYQNDDDVQPAKAVGHA